MQAIETFYNGYAFRSRLEAIWGVFFDTLGIEYQYEPETFNLGDGIWYLPDFWLPKLDVWIEIKGPIPNEIEMEKARKLREVTNKTVFILFGGPQLQVSHGELEITSVGVYEFNSMGYRRWGSIDRDIFGWLSYIFAEDNLTRAMGRALSFRFSKPLSEVLLDMEATQALQDELLLARTMVDFAVGWVHTSKEIEAITAAIARLNRKEFNRESALRSA